MSPHAPADNPFLFSAVIGTYERHRLLAGAIDSLLQQDLDHSYEIIVVDNSRDQAAAADFGRRYEGAEKVRYVLEPMVGISNAWNRGAELARGRIVGLMDDDARATPNWMRQIIVAFDAYDGRAGCVGGRVLPQWAAPHPGWLPDELLGYLSVVDWGGGMRELRAEEWFAGCNLAFDRLALLAAGGFPKMLGRRGSELTLLSQNEFEACRNVAKLGKLLIYAPEAVVEHIIDPSRLTQEWMRRRIAWQTVSEYIDNPDRMAALAAEMGERMHCKAGSRVSQSRDEFLREHQAVRDLTLGLLSGRIGLNTGPKRSLAHRLRNFVGLWRRR